jgi:carbon storage regulator
MLVLSRKENETIKIGDNIRVTITRVRDGRVRVAIEAPRSVRVVREEIESK